MKTEINLRTREFIITREFYWPRLLITLGVVALVAIFLGGSIFIYLYKMQLTLETKNLTQEKINLQARVAPLEELEIKINDLEKREKLADALMGETYPWSDHFRMIYHVAEANRLRATALMVVSDNMVLVRGESPSMRQIALLMQDLVEEQGGGFAIHKYMNYPKNNRSIFEIELTLSDNSKGGDQ